MVTSHTSTRETSLEGRAKTEVPANHGILAESDTERGVVSETVAVPPRESSGFKWAAIILGIYSSTFLFALDNTVVSDVQPKLVLEFPDGISKIACKFPTSG